MPALIDLTGQRFGRLLVLARAENIGGEAGWRARCDCGATTHVRGNKLRQGHTRSCGCLREDVTRQRGYRNRRPVVGYFGAHWRVKSLRGSARDHTCVDCGSAADDWSYDGQDRDERFAISNGYLLAYSLDPAHYEPRCRKCHGAFDALSRKVSERCR